MDKIIDKSVQVKDPSRTESGRTGQSRTGMPITTWIAIAGLVVTATYSVLAYRQVQEQRADFLRNSMAGQS